MKRFLLTSITTLLLTAIMQAQTPKPDANHSNFINVTDFGAIPDDTQDDTEQLQAAIN